MNPRSFRLSLAFGAALLFFTAGCGSNPAVRVEVRAGEDPKPMLEVLDSRGVEMALEVAVIKEDKVAWNTVARAFAVDCAERALEREIAAGRQPDPRSLEAIRIAKLHASGDAFDKELEAARADAFAVVKGKMPTHQYADWAAVHFAEPAWPGDYELGPAGYAAKAAASNRAASESAPGNQVWAELAEMTAAAAAAWAVADSRTASNAGDGGRVARDLFFSADSWSAFSSHLLSGAGQYGAGVKNSELQLEAWNDERVWQKEKLRSYLVDQVVPEVYEAPAQ